MKSQFEGVATFKTKLKAVEDLGIEVPSDMTEKAILKVARNILDGRHVAKLLNYYL